MSQSTDESRSELPPPLPGGKWVQSSEEYRAARQKLKEQWADSEAELTEDLDRVDRVVALLRAKRFALQLSPEMAEFGNDEAPDLEEAPLLGETGTKETGTPVVQESPVEASTEDIEVAEDLSAEHWTPETERLYDDVLYLFESGDLDGALVSLERLLLLAGRNPEVREFVTLNESKLLKLYQRSLGDFSGVPKREARMEPMPMSFLQRPAIARVFNAVNGETPFQDILEQVDSPAVDICAALNQLRRSRQISVVQ